MEPHAPAGLRALGELREKDAQAGIDPTAPILAVASALITHNEGQRIGHKLVSYMDERVTYAERWHGAIRNWPKPLSFTWGMLDPVATPAVLEGLRKLRPQAPVDELPDLGHYPQIEDPPRIAAALREALAHA